MKTFLWLTALIIAFALPAFGHDEPDSIHLPDFKLLARAKEVIAKDVPKNVVDERALAEKDGFHVLSKNLIDLGSVKSDDKSHLHRVLYVEVWHKHGGKDHDHSKDGSRVITTVVTVDHEGTVAFTTAFGLPAESNVAPKK